MGDSTSLSDPRDNATKHGAHSERYVSPIADEVKAELLDTVPYLASPAFAEAVDSYAWKVAQVRLIRDWLDRQQGGAIDTRGRTRTAGRTLDTLERSLAAERSKLGLDPKSAAELMRSGLSIEARSAYEALLDEGRRLALREGSTDDR